ncbi:response regulator [Maribellus comscasis]|uniref:Response regulator n=1 Tax=Maribellus comscasis TaxID=2681766 RepID=A0A6I6JSN1_9BACT|nr:LytTR family DNA-binding domain-containing protein [Maribellus comscasis]QGY43162.1 response regulator [Maribellus comscasis]
MIIDCIIIEDEPLAINKMEGYINRISYLNLTGKFRSAIDAIGFIQENKPHLIFLDIQMEHMTGIQLLETLSQKPKVIITTAYQEYAIKGYDLQVSDYLLKPIQFERFVQACEKSYHEIENTGTKEQDFIFVKTEYRLEKINMSSILYIEGMRDYRHIITKDKKIMTLQTFKDIEKALPANQFMRVHNSFIVSVDKIESIEKNRIHIKNKLIPISDSKREEFYKRIKNKMI